MCSSKGISISAWNAKPAKPAKLVVSLRSLRALRSISFPHKREQDHVADRRAVGQQHDEPVDADAFPAGRWQAVLERADVVLVHRVRLEVAARAVLQLRFEASPLLDRIVELAEGVRHLEPADVELEPLDRVGVVPLLLR